MDKIKLFFLGNKTPDYEDKLPSQISLTCRGLVGGYVLYLAKGLIDGMKTAATSQMLIIVTIAIVIFAVCGGALLYVSLRDYILGRYIGGKLDLGERPKEDDDVVITQENDNQE